MQTYGYRVGNIDATVVMEHPKLAPFIEEMRQKIATALGITCGQISVKATTSEKMGFAGRQEGVAVHACALVVPED
jgi:2-C-methyl-D-erythritol 2,4-cyclodiphosphate synthase